MAFHWSLSDCKSPQVFKTQHSIQADLKKDAVWMVSVLLLLLLLLLLLVVVVVVVVVVIICRNRHSKPYNAVEIINIT